MTTTQGFRLSGWHVLAIMVAFFGVIIAVDGAFMAAAYRSFPGQVAVTPYEDGLAYNRKVAQRQAQAALGWQATLARQSAGVTFEVHDAKGGPVRDLKVRGELRRPATESGRIWLNFTETTPGRYLAVVSPAAGGWDVEIAATGPGGVAFEAERRLTWP